MAELWKAPAIGVNFGDKNTKLAVLRNGAVEFITDEKGNRSFPTYLAFIDDKHHVGEAANEDATLDPVNVVFGLTHDIQTLIGKLPFAPTPDPNNKPSITMFLQKLRERAEAQLGTSVKYAVIAVPMALTDEERNAIKNAAGFLEVEIMIEPSAGALAYNYATSKEETSAEAIAYHNASSKEDKLAYGAAVQGAILCGQPGTAIGLLNPLGSSVGEIWGEDLDDTT